MKIKYGNNPNPKSILDSSYKIKKVKDDFFDGYISMVDVNKAKRPKIVPRYNGREQKIFDDNHKWLMLFPNIKSYTITAMYDENLTLIEFYIDMIDKIGMTNEGIPYMHDLFLDVVITYEREVYILDQDELYEALQNKEITPKQYDLANKTSKEVISFYTNKKNFDDLRNYCDKYLRKMLEK